MAGCSRWAGVAVLAALMCAGTTSAHEVLKPSKLYKFATNETSFTAKFENKGLGFAYIIMQPCLGHNLILCLLLLLLLLLLPAAGVAAASGTALLR